MSYFSWCYYIILSFFHPWPFCTETRLGNRTHWNVSLMGSNSIKIPPKSPHEYHMSWDLWNTKIPQLWDEATLQVILKTPAHVHELSIFLIIFSWFVDKPLTYFHHKLTVHHIDGFVCYSVIYILVAFTLIIFISLTNWMAKEEVHGENMQCSIYIYTSLDWDTWSYARRISIAGLTQFLRKRPGTANLKYYLFKNTIIINTFVVAG